MINYLLALTTGLVFFLTSAIDPHHAQARSWKGQSLPVSVGTE